MIPKKIKGINFMNSFKGCKIRKRIKKIKEKRKYTIKKTGKCDTFPFELFLYKN